MEPLATDTAVGFAPLSPFTQENLGAAGLDAYARQLSHRLILIGTEREHRRLLSQRRRELLIGLDDSADTVEQAYKVAAEQARSGIELSPDAEWLLDNYYVVDELIRDIRQHMPTAFLRELPCVLSGRPRVYELARELIAHSDSALDEMLLENFVESFQTDAVLSIGETWALPVMLRLVLLQHLSSLARQFLYSHQCHVDIEVLMQQTELPTRFDLDASSIVHCGPKIVELNERLRAAGEPGVAALRSLERHVQSLGFDLEELLRLENRRQAAAQVSIGNVITSMRLISTLDWIDFFEHTNRAEQVLRRDPLGVYGQMDFASRNRYRTVVERIAKASERSDEEIANQALKLANSFGKPAVSSGDLRTHVGYWLVGDGAASFVERFTLHRPMSGSLNDAIRAHPARFYFGTIIALWLVATLLFIAIGRFADVAVSTLWALGMLAFLPLSEVVLSTTHAMITRLVSPHLLPKLEFESGIPEEHPTMVVVPSMLTSPRDVRTLIDRLENHFLANNDRMLRFALLTDFADAATEETAGDAELLELAIAGIRALNDRHGDAGAENANQDEDSIEAAHNGNVRQTGSYQPFYLFHRQRRWNPSEGVWMGWERKRGKLMEFGQLLRGDQQTSYIAQAGDTQWLSRLRDPKVRPFIITLDADTILPRDTARRLVGTLAHPLNRARTSPEGGWVKSGYTILQPRVSVHLAGARQTRYVETFANSPGIDPYTTAASDVYQDLFAEGSFTGKGIYDLHAFERALEEAFPDNQILSHDLIEGCHARVALVSDIEVYDSYPARYDADTRRSHRWIRGDWQISPWLFPRVPYASGTQPNRLSGLSRWKIADNLRRSLTVPFLVAMLIVGWFSSSNAAWLVTGAALVISFWPVLVHVTTSIIDLPKQKYWLSYLAQVWRQGVQTLEQCALMLTFAMHRAGVMCDAIVRTLYRMLFSRRKLLEWETAAAVENRLSNQRWSVMQQMWYSPVVALAVLPLLPSVSARWASLAFTLPWIVAPLVAFLISQPRRPTLQTLSEQDRQKLRRWASATWSFFEAYVNEQSNWLPPDNVQDYPREKVAYRISPTNEGLFLVSGLAARDFGFIGLHALVELWERNWKSWQSLEQIRGHHYNWYETRQLLALQPRYVSTVDSGNLAACYLTLNAAIVHDLLNQPVLSPQVHQGLLDTLDWLDAAAQPLFTDKLESRSRHRIEDLVRTIAKTRREITERPDTTVDWRQLLARLDGNRETLSQLAVSLGESSVTERLGKKVVLAVARVDGIVHDVQQLLPTVHWSESASLTTPTEDDTLLALTLRELAEVATPSLRGADESIDVQQARQLRAAAATAQQLVSRLQQLASEFEQAAERMDFKFLYNARRKLFSIGFNVEDSRLDRSHYDMLCSEARLASYLAIAKGDTDTNHWFRLGRQSTQIEGQLVLMSWGGTMFEYMMPPLFQKQYAGSLLTESCRAAIRRQKNYAASRGVPWGISESAYSSLAANSDYLYRSFGTPGLGLKRGLAKDLVISPYSTMLVLPLEPKSAIENLQTLTSEGAVGDWGFYEALDYTQSRLRRGRRVVPVECYMAHHQGMSLTALANALMDHVMQRRFHQHPWARANELLLQERVPQIATPDRPKIGQVEQAPAHKDESGLVSRRITGIQTNSPRTHLLSNGQASLMLSHTGGGYLQWQDQQVTRWRSDVTRDNWGSFIYLHDLDSGQLWSPTYQPTRMMPDAYEVIFAMDKAEFHRRQGEIETTLEVAVSPECNAEVRQLRLINHGATARRLNVTSYAELVLSTAAADIAHPAFQKLFIETEYIHEETSLVARRRPRSSDGQPLYAVHTISVPNDRPHDVQYDTSRFSFIGRNQTTETPYGATCEKLAGNIGAVLDPVFALRTQIILAPEEAVTISFSTAVASSREQALTLADQFHDARGVHRVFELAWAYARTESRHGHLDGAKVHLYQRLGSALLYPDQSLRGNPANIAGNTLSQAGLWRYGISGDLPIIACHVSETEHTELVRELVAAHRFLLSAGLYVDLVIINDYPGSYIDALQDQLLVLINESQVIERRLGAVHLLRGAQLPPEDHRLMETVAACVLSGTRGSLAQQLDAAAANRTAVSTSRVKQFLRVDRVSSDRATSDRATSDRATSDRASTSHRATASVPKPGEPFKERSSEPDLSSARVDAAHVATHVAAHDAAREFANGLGGFVEQGQAYVIELSAGNRPRAPWSNVIANERFGTLITESGGGNSWLENSRENKLTSWCNDPVSDQPSEVLYVRDDEAGELWSPLAAPGSDPRSQFRCQHGFGYSHFHHTCRQLQQDVYVTVAEHDPVKIIRVRFRNTGNNHRTLTCTYYVEWVLGVAREISSRTLVTERDDSTGALLARNPYSFEFSEQVAFLQILAPSKSLTGDRRSFLGRNGSIVAPQALAETAGENATVERSPQGIASGGKEAKQPRYAPLDGRVGAALDPCGAVQSTLHIAAGETAELFILLGAGANRAETVRLLEQYNSVQAADEALTQSAAAWKRTLGALTVQTPNRGLDVLANGWLQYQTLSCRLWGRSAFYQSGGAFGFRDQLQDVMALVNTRPELARQHILRAAARQFIEGDVQHWWHPPGGKGTRTRFSDDFLFLPYVTDFYLRSTGDESILDEQVAFVSSPLLHDHEQERYEQPTVAMETATLYEHCLRAIQHGRRYGQHDLPLMGCGDWNDGMNKVGEEGRGESVWVAFFQIVVFEQFSHWIAHRDGQEKAAELLQVVERLRNAVEESAWDGSWYRRAFFDDGSPLGSQTNDECCIDSLAQSWSVIARANADRSQQAMRSAVDRLVRNEEGLVLLFTPPFNQSDLDPGYIKGYLPGIRENGGQYTHAATWMIDAAARLRDGNLAMRLFDLLNPIHHTSTRDRADRYRVEPYVVAADVYGVAPHVGMGGWTWYTGSASWMYRVAVESILGIRLQGAKLTVDPVVPDDWQQFQFTYRRGHTTWHVTMRRQDQAAPPFAVDLVEDGAEHQIEGWFAGSSQNTLHVN